MPKHNRAAFFHIPVFLFAPGSLLCHDLAHANSMTARTAENGLLYPIWKSAPASRFLISHTTIAATPIGAKILWRIPTQGSELFLLSTTPSS